MSFPPSDNKHSSSHKSDKLRDNSVDSMLKINKSDMISTLNTIENRIPEKRRTATEILIKEDTGNRRSSALLERHIDRQFANSVLSDSAMMIPETETMQE